MLGGIPAVRAAIEKQNETNREAGLPEVHTADLLTLAENLAPSLKAADWRDRADAAMADIDTLDLRDLRSVVVGADPGAAITSTMTDLTAALNEVMSALNTATNPQGGDLARDPGAQALKRAMGALAGSIVMPGAAEGTPRTLSDLGLTTQRDGTFILDTKRLSATLKAAPDAAAAMFTNALFGVYASIDALSRSASKTGNPSSLAGSISRYTAQKTQIAAETAKVTEAQEKLRASLAKRFAVTDSRVGTSRATLSFLQNQIDAWNAPRN